MAPDRHNGVSLVVSPIARSSVEGQFFGEEGQVVKLACYFHGQGHGSKSRLELIKKLLTPVMGGYRSDPPPPPPLCSRIMVW